MPRRPERRVRVPCRCAERVREELVGRINLSLEIMWHEHHRQNDSGDDVTDDHLDKTDVSAVGNAGNADDGERARLGGDDGQPDAPPRNVFAAEEVVASVVLVFAEPNSQANNAEQIQGNDRPITAAEVTVHLESA